MGYPTSVQSFTTKNDGSGNPINAAHVNDLQTEVAAIETGLLNGITHNFSLGAALSVTGGSTFAVRPVEPPPHAALVYLDSTGALGSSANSTLSFLAQAFAINSSLHSTGTNPERITPQSTGLYQITGQLSLSSNSTGYRQVLIQDSSGNVVAAQLVNGSSSPIRVQATGYKRFDAVGGYVVCRMNQDGASSLSFSTGVGESWLAMVKL